MKKASDMSIDELRDAIVAAENSTISSAPAADESKCIIRIPYGSAELVKVPQRKADGSFVVVESGLASAESMLSVIIPKSAEKALLKMGLNGRLAYSAAWLNWYSKSDRKDFYTLDWGTQSFERCVLLSKGVLPAGQ